VKNRGLYKTTIVIWSEWDTSDTELDVIGWEAMQGDAYCSIFNTTYVKDPKQDPLWEETEFFDLSEE
jgi:hypothetical protein